MPRAKYYRPHAVRKVTRSNFYRYSPAVQEVVRELDRLGCWAGDLVSLHLLGTGRLRLAFHRTPNGGPFIELPAQTMLDHLKAIPRPDVYADLQGRVRAAQSRP